MGLIDLFFPKETSPESRVSLFEQSYEAARADEQIPELQLVERVSGVGPTSYDAEVSLRDSARRKGCGYVFGVRETTGTGDTFFGPAKQPMLIGDAYREK